MKETPQLNQLHIPGLEEYIKKIAIEAIREQRETIHKRGASHTNKKWYNLHEASERLHCSKKTVSRLIKRGDLLKHLGIRHIRIPAHSIEGYEQKFLVRKGFQNNSRN